MAKKRTTKEEWEAYENWVIENVSPFKVTDWIKEAQAFGVGNISGYCLTQMHKAYEKYKKDYMKGIEHRQLYNEEMEK